jgi:hypothetical protein
VGRWDAADRPTAFIQSGELRMTIGKEDLIQARTVRISVANPGAVSAAFDFPILADLEVGNDGDEVNGDTRSVAALTIAPGADGISFREALVAVNATPGRHTIAIASSLAGRALVLTRDLPPLTRDSVTMTGLRGADGNPAFTLDALGINGPAALIVHASDFTLRYFRIRNIPPRASSALYIEAGKLYGGEPGPARTRIERVAIEDNEFTNEAVNYSPTTQTHAISVRGDPFTSDVTLSDVTITRNRFAGYKGDSLPASAALDACWSAS